MARKKYNKKKKLNAGEVKDKLAEKYRKTGSLRKEENLSRKNAAATMRAANNVMKKNPNASKEEVINKTQKELRENKEKYLNERKGIREGIKETRKEVEKQKEKAFKDITGSWVEKYDVESRGELNEEAKERERKFIDEASEELGPGTTVKEIKKRADKKTKEWKKKH